MVSDVRNFAAVTLANSLNQYLQPKGFSQLGSTKTINAPGFSTTTALNLFEPNMARIDMEGSLLTQRMLQRLDEKPERVDARTVQSRMRNREPIENTQLRTTSEKVFAYLEARFGIRKSSGPQTPFAATSKRPKEAELFGTDFSGQTLNSSLTISNDTRVSVSGGNTFNVTDFQAAAASTTPEFVVVRLDGSERRPSAEVDDPTESFDPPGGKLILNGSVLASGEAHTLTFAEYQQLTYKSGTSSGMDYLSVVSLDQSGNERGELITSAITTNAGGVEKRTRDGLERFEYIGKTEANAFIPRATFDVEGTFVNGDFISDLNAGLIEVTVAEFGNDGNKAQKLTDQSSGNSLDVTFGNKLATNGVVFNVVALDPAVEITDVRVSFG
ncbi:MAG: hypothetical protein RIM72_09590 [Alphaproteobacteria bacterium]